MTACGCCRRPTSARGWGSWRCPSLWLFGDRDTLVPWRWSEALPQLLPDARSELIPGAAHVPFLSHFEQCVNLLQAFLDGLP